MVEAGEVRIFLMVEEGDWFAGVVRDKEQRSPAIRKNADPAPETTEWQRIGSEADLPEIHLAPAYPDRALVVRPKVSYALIPGERVQFFVGVPVWIRVAGPSDLTLFQVSTSSLSNTWFGLPTEGELAYAMRTRARRDVKRLGLDPLQVVCSVRIKNQSKEMITFERICIRPRFLSLYEDSRHGLWANESSMIVRSAQEASRVAYARKAPAHLNHPHAWIKGAEEATGTHFLRALGGGKGLFNE